MQVTMGARCWNGERRRSLERPQMEKITDCTPVATELGFWTKAGRRLNDPKVRMMIGYGVPLMLLASGLPPLGLTHAIVHTVVPSGEVVPAMAGVIADGVKDKVMHAFDPLIHLVQYLAYPIAGVMIAGGCLMIMVQQREAGMKMLQNAAIGYILVQLSPLLLNLLVGIGGSI